MRKQAPAQKQGRSSRWRLAITVCAGLCAIAALYAALLCSMPDAPLLEQTRFGAVALDARGGILRIALAADGRYRLRASIDQIAPAAVEAALAYEDRHFYAHPGVNPVALLRGAASLLGGRRMGGSTITMQTARLLFGLATNSIAGKIRQIWLALALEAKFSKTEILEAYFNLAPYGGNVEGIEAASRIYFHKSAARLTLREARALALVPQNPCARRPGTTHFEAARRRIYGDAAPLRVHAAANLPFAAPHLCMEILANAQGERQTFIERDLQNLLERAISDFARRGSRFGIANAAAMIVRRADMAVVALAGSANYHNAAISGQIDGSRARRSPGSTLKPFIYALALDQGLLHPHTILADSPRSFGGYDPENFDRSFRGPVAAHAALKASRNLPAIALAERLRGPNLYDFLRQAQVELPRGPEYYGLALVLGGAEVSMRELVSLYAMLANQGLWQPLRALKSDPVAAPRRLLSPEAAWLCAHMLPDAEIQGVKYKTGTSNGLRDAWTVGIAGDYVLAVWAGNFDNSSNPHLVGARVALPLFEAICRGLAGLCTIVDRFVLPPPGLNLRRERVCAATGDFYREQCENTEETWIIPGVSPVRDTGIIRKIWIDRATGRRACAASGADAVWWEFWPTDMRAIFASAGINKPEAPAWLPQCLPEQRQAAAGKKPRILLPKRNVVYHRRGGDFRLPLLAAADAEARQIFWYANGRYLGNAPAGEMLFWQAPAGNAEIMAVDDAGRSTRQQCRIVALP